MLSVCLVGHFFCILLYCIVVLVPRAKLFFEIFYFLLVLFLTLWVCDNVDKILRFWMVSGLNWKHLESMIIIWSSPLMTGFCSFVKYSKSWIVCLINSSFADTVIVPPWFKIHFSWYFTWQRQAFKVSFTELFQHFFKMVLFLWFYFIVLKNFFKKMSPLLIGNICIFLPLLGELFH